MEDRPRGSVAPHVASDADLVARAREGDRIAFGVLYLRHHAAAWRLASASSGFTADAELAVIAGFNDVFRTLPRAGDPSFRAHLLTCVRRAALERNRSRRPGPGSRWPARPGRTKGDDPAGAVRAALASLPETRRAALWLTDVEAMTPTEVAAVVGVEPRAVPRLAGQARARLGSAVHAAPLAAAAPAPPLLGGECQRYWLAHHDAAESPGGEPPGDEQMPAAGRAGGRPRAPGRGTSRWSPVVAVTGAVVTMVLGLPLPRPAPPGPATTVAVSPEVRGYLPGTPAPR